MMVASMLSYVYKSVGFILILGLILTRTSRRLSSQLINHAKLPINTPSQFQLELIAIKILIFELSIPVHPSHSCRPSAILSLSSSSSSS